MLKKLFMTILLLSALAGCATTNNVLPMPANGLIELNDNVDVQLLFSNPNHSTVAPEDQRFEFYENKYQWKNSFTGGIGMMTIYRF